MAKASVFHESRLKNRFPNSISTIRILSKPVQIRDLDKIWRKILSKSRIWTGLDKIIIVDILFGKRYLKSNSWNTLAFAIGNPIFLI